MGYYPVNQGYPGIQNYSQAPYRQMPMSEWGMQQQQVLQSSLQQHEQQQQQQQQATLKSSKSYGDILNEIKKEDANGTAAHRALASGNRDAYRKLSSQTPPPRPVPFRGNTLVNAGTGNMLDSWIPWPDLVSSIVISSNAKASTGIFREWGGEAKTP